jgi:predicted small lipoprotein YifL
MRSLAMTPPTLISRKALLAVLLAGTMALATGACGRRGRPEPPPNPDAPAKVQGTKATEQRASRRAATFDTRPGAVAEDDDDEEEETEAAALASPSVMPTGRKKSQPFLVPKEPFFLDPLL